MEYYAALKILTHATACLNLEDIIFSEISQSQKDKYRMIPFYEVLQFCCSVVADSLRATPWTAAHQAYLSTTNSQSLPKPMSIVLVKLWGP